MAKRKYINADIVFERVAASLKTYVDRDMIIEEEYYKVIEKCNEILGLRLNPIKETIIILNNGVGNLPNDFLMLEAAVSFCKTSETYSWQTKKEVLKGITPTLEMKETILCNDIQLVCGTIPYLEITYETHTEKYDKLIITRLRETEKATDDCVNLYSNSPYTISIDDDKIYSDSGLNKIYIRYTASMFKDGLPICLDNAIIMEYYEKALKYEMLVDLLVNKKLEIVQLIQLVKQELVIAKADAINLISTPEYDELRNINKYLKKLSRKMNVIKI